MYCVVYSLIQHGSTVHVYTLKFEKKIERYSVSELITTFFFKSLLVYKDQRRAV